MQQPKRDATLSSQPLSVDELLRPDAFPHAVGELALRETHISWVVLTGQFAYKIKKPVKLDFIDASTLELRRHYCAEELRLNRRLAPDLYVDVVPITVQDGRVMIGGHGPVLDYAVRMRQFAACDELPELLATNAVTTAQVESLARRLAAFHSSAAVAAAQRTPEKTDQMYEAVLGNLAQLLEHLEGVDPASLSRLVEWTLAQARALEDTFQLRERNGFIRECHGDLHAGNIVRDGNELVPFDCIEFDPRLRWIDVINDIAFLVMDLMSYGRNELAVVLLNRYLEATGDYRGVQVLPFYAVYRALVRAKVDALMAAQAHVRAAEFREKLRRRIQAASSWTTPRQPVLILMHGASGSGKSWLSKQLTAELPAIRIRSDLERKRLAGISVTQSATADVRQGIYSPHFTYRTYSHLADSAEGCLRAGLHVIVDAAFLDPAERALFRSLARQMGSPCVIVSCQADPATLAARILDRTKRANPSDANLSVLDTQLREIKPFDAAEQSCVVPIDTSAPDAVQRVVAAIRARCAL
ncbi:MAG: AAA family ATPase [Steroidobacteraceae bacterium]